MTEASRPGGDAGRPASNVDGTVPLFVRRGGAIDLDRVLRTLTSGASEWLGTPAGSPTEGLASYLCDLELSVGPGRRFTFRKAAIVSLGSPHREADRWIVPIEWRAATAAPLFPVFVGRLVASPDSLVLEGRYAPPFGVVGHVLDHALLGIAARRMATWLLARIEEAIGRPSGGDLE
jgi:hypothetical protein